MQFSFGYLNTCLQSKGITFSVLLLEGASESYPKEHLNTKFLGLCGLKPHR